MLPSFSLGTMSLSSIVGRELFSSSSGPSSSSGSSSVSVESHPEIAKNQVNLEDMSGMIGSSTLQSNHEDLMDVVRKFIF